VYERERVLQRARALHPKASAEFAAEMLRKDFQVAASRAAEAQSLSHDEPLRRALEAVCRLPAASYEEPQWEALEAILALLKPGRGAPEGAVRRDRQGGLHRVLARRAACAGLGGRPERSAARARPEDLAHPGGRVPGHLAVAVRAADQADLGLAAGRRPHAVRRRRSHAVDLPLPRGRGGPLPRGEEFRRRLGEARAAHPGGQFPLAGEPGLVVQRLVRARPPRGRGRNLGRRALLAFQRPPSPRCPARR